MRVLAWSEECGHPDPSLITQPNILRFLANFELAQTRKHVLKALSLILQRAVMLGWRTDNPARGIRIKVPVSKAAIWEQSDVDCYVTAARETGFESIARIILLEWEIGQRLTDVRAFRAGVGYDPAAGVFSFLQSKTGASVTLEVSPALREQLAEASAAGRDGFLFFDEITGKTYSQHRLAKVFGRVRTRAVEAGAKPLILRQLRHSCVVQLARAGCTVPEIGAITGHTLGSVNSILGVYLPRDSAVARNAQIKRGLIARTEIQQAFEVAASDTETEGRTSPAAADMAVRAGP
ncbi:MAG: hypothetical protein EON59_03385 [Alphaproteobacteria bacterium]|nr:MAG: hypothetical protein EON59_03385 [Alphaproteobacteria bacterium]